MPFGQVLGRVGVQSPGRRRVSEMSGLSRAGAAGLLVVGLMVVVGCGAIPRRIGRGICRVPARVRDRDAGGGAEPAVRFGDVTPGNGSAAVGGLLRA